MSGGPSSTVSALVDYIPAMGSLVNIVAPMAQSHRLHQFQLAQDKNFHVESLKISKEMVSKQMEQSETIHTQSIAYDKQFHSEAIHLEIKQHKESLKQNERIHRNSIDHDSKLQREAIDVSTALHQREIELSKSLHSEAVLLDGYIHHDTLLKSTRLHNKALKHAKLLTYAGFEHDQVLHEHSVAVSRELHREACAIDREFARREEMRDMLHQRTLKVNTLMIVDTLMFGCAFALFIEGMQLVPETSKGSINLTVFSIMFTLAICFLFISVWAAMSQQSRMSKYNIAKRDIIYRPCGHRHPTFEHFYNCHCKKLSIIAKESFYLGTIFFMVALAVIVFVIFNEVHELPAAGIIFSVSISLTIVTLVISRLIFTSPSPDLGEDDINGAKHHDILHSSSHPPVSPTSADLLVRSARGKSISPRNTGTGFLQHLGAQKSEQTSTSAPSQQVIDIYAEYLEIGKNQHSRSRSPSPPGRPNTTPSQLPTPPKVTKIEETDSYNLDDSQTISYLTNSESGGNNSKTASSDSMLCDGEYSSSQSNTEGHFSFPQPQIRVLQSPADDSTRPQSQETKGTSLHTRSGSRPFSRDSQKRSWALDRGSIDSKSTPDHASHPKHNRNNVNILTPSSRDGVAGIKKQQLSMPPQISLLGGKSNRRSSGSILLAGDVGIPSAMPLPTRGCSLRQIEHAIRLARDNDSILDAYVNLPVHRLQAVNPWRVDQGDSCNSDDESIANAQAIVDRVRRSANTTQTFANPIITPRNNSPFTHRPGTPHAAAPPSPALPRIHQVFSESDPLIRNSLKNP